MSNISESVHFSPLPAADDPHPEDSVPHNNGTAGDSKLKIRSSVFIY